MHIAYLGIGTSMGSRKRNLLFASQLLSAHHQIGCPHSSIWTSTPLGRAQCSFANAVIKIKTFKPYQLCIAKNFPWDEQHKDGPID